jgi:hypothetical protein
MDTKQEKQSSVISTPQDKQQELNNLENSIDSASSGHSEGIIVEPINLDDILKALGIAEVSMKENIDVFSEISEQDTTETSGELPVEIFSVFPEDQEI